MHFPSPRLYSTNWNDRILGYYIYTGVITFSEFSTVCQARAQTGWPQQ